MMPTGMVWEKATRGIGGAGRLHIVGFLFTMRFNVEFHLFLTALSVLPRRSLAISAQRLPMAACASMIVLSSSGVQAPLRMLGLR